MLLEEYITADTEIIDPNAIATAAAANSGITNTTGVYDVRYAPTPFLESTQHLRWNPTQHLRRNLTVNMRKMMMMMTIMMIMTMAKSRKYNRQRKTHQT